jgi:hypothetical protein
MIKYCAYCGVKTAKMTKKDFYKQHKIKPDDLGWLGSGDNGNAYDAGDNRVLKITRSHHEFQLAKKLVGRKDLTNFATYFAAEQIGSEYYILMEQLETDTTDIEHLWHDMEHVLETQGIPIQYIDHFDEDDYEEHYEKIPHDLEKFMHDIYGVVQDYRKIGIHDASDIKYDNLGRDAHHKLKAFDIFDRSNHG